MRHGAKSAMPRYGETDCQDPEVLRVHKLDECSVLDGWAVADTTTQKEEQ